MSVTQKNLPICTRTSVLDHLFILKHKLSYSEAIMMSYILLLKSWATHVGEGFYLLHSTKIEKDLPFGKKTIEAIFTKLKKLKLIETKRVKIEKWSLTQTYRAIHVTDAGKEYNLSYHKPEEHQFINVMKEKLEESKANIEYLKRTQEEIKEENNILTLQVKSRDIFLESNEKTTQKAQNILNQKEDFTTQIEALKKELEEAKEIIKANKKALLEKSNPTATEQETPFKIEKSLRIFRRKIIKEYASSGSVLCNGVPNWGHNVNFYINSYSKVTVKLLTGDFQQLTNIDEINHFWKWLFNHQDRVGQPIKKPINPQILKLMEYENKIFQYDNKPYSIVKIDAVEGGVSILIENKENTKKGYLTHNHQNILKVEEAIGALKAYDFAT